MNMPLLLLVALIGATVGGPSMQRQGKYKEAIKYHSMVLSISEREGEDSKTPNSTPPVQPQRSRRNLFNNPNPTTMWRLFPKPNRLKKKANEKKGSKWWVINRPRNGK
ncbi:hypothetical protein HanIR_Chr08g0388551 [Helianthus annuus]|nr:hypothetical protein HanIR_Chr08g0388551 [Helianthus annuus]